MKPHLNWTPDCQGKQDYDGPLVYVSTRYWPRGGGFMAFDRGSGVFEENADRPHIRPRANAAIYLNDHDRFNEEGVPLCDQDFEGETEEEVKAAVEAWIEQQFDRIAASVRQSLTTP